MRRPVRPLQTGQSDSMPAVTGSRISLLPPENATGNYVKVVQRVPVRSCSTRRPTYMLRPACRSCPTVRCWS